MDTDVWMNKARESLKSLDLDGRKFELKDLFIGSEWLQLSEGERRLFGRNFAEAVREGQFPNVEAIPIGKSRHNRYRKISDHE